MAVSCLENVAQNPRQIRATVGRRQKIRSIEARSKVFESWILSSKYIGLFLSEHRFQSHYVRELNLLDNQSTHTMTNQDNTSLHKTISIALILEDFSFLTSFLLISGLSLIWPRRECAKSLISSTLFFISLQSATYPKLYTRTF